jgi:beta-galactosidase
MKQHLVVRLAFGVILLFAFTSQNTIAAQIKSSTVHTFAAGHDGQFLLDGQPFQIHAGEMHYPRVPRAYWRDRMRKMKAMGLNTLTTYVFWNVHETAPGEYDFNGQNDLAEFLQEAQQEGLYVILRPGPYVCAEWEFGGFPAWLLKDRSMVVRSRDPKFMAVVGRWFQRLGEVVRPFMLAQGGPILAVQVENEYGSFGNDHVYMEGIKSLLKSNGMGDGYLYTADGPGDLGKGSLPNVPAAVNFGPGEAQKAFAALKTERPNDPMMSGEYWDGWFDHWGQAHQLRPAAQQESDLQWMLQHGYSFNLYMAEGGTSFGWMNGANSDGDNYEPDTTSYDYDVAIDERGALRPKFFAFRDLITKAGDATAPQPPAATTALSYPVMPVVESASLWENLPSAVKSQQPLSMEDLGQSYGYILYTTRLHGTAPGMLHLDELHDYAAIFLDHQPVGVLDRRLGQSQLELAAVPGNQELEILIENSGRVNYTVALRGERKGITHNVTLGGTELTGWNIYSLPMRDPGSINFTRETCAGPCFFRTRMSATGPNNALLDTFLNTTGIRKGTIWVNGRALGRAWSVGPQGALYLPGVWLHNGSNEIEMFDVAAEGFDKLSSQPNPLWVAPSQSSAGENDGK